MSSYVERTLAAFERLEKENAKLREELESVGTAAYLYGRSDLKAENAKLRELVRDMWEMAYPEYPSAFEAAFADRMRELGIEASADA